MLCLPGFWPVMNDDQATDETFGIVEGLMTTCHAYTNDQVILDFKDVTAFSSAAMAFLSRKGLLQVEGGKLWRAINAPVQNP